MTRWLLIIVLLIPGMSVADDPPRTLVPCTVVRVHDGDSFIATVPFLFADGVSRTDMVRVQGADAWEVDQSRAGTVGKISDEEIAKGKVARDAVIVLFGNADAIYLEPRRKGDIAEPHGRISAHVWVWNKQTGTLTELAPWLIEHGHVRTRK